MLGECGYRCGWLSVSWEAAHQHWHSHPHPLLVNKIHCLKLFLREAQKFLRWTELPSHSLASPLLIIICRLWMFAFNVNEISNISMMPFWNHWFAYLCMYMKLKIIIWRMCIFMFTSRWSTSTPSKRKKVLLNFKTLKKYREVHFSSNYYA